MEEASAMAISLPAPDVEAAMKSHVAPAGEAPAVEASRLPGAAGVLRHFRERVFSSIFDADGDCMHL